MANDAPTRRRKLAAILMADVSGFSAMMGRDEERTTQLIQEFHRRVESTLKAHEGRVVDTAGDSVFGEFDSVVNAVRCAQQILVEEERVNAAGPETERMQTRIGVHLGDVIVEDQRVFGDGVNIAARLEQLAEPGSLLVSEAVYQQVHNKVELGFQDLGPRELKNIQQPVRVYRVGDVATRAPTETVITTRPQPPARSESLAPQTEVAGPATPVSARAAQTATRTPALELWINQILRMGVLVPVVLGLALLAAPLIGIPSGGLLPTVGAVLLGSMLGEVWVRLTQRRGNRLVLLGVGIMTGAWFTGWSQFTDGLFLLGGLLTVAWGVSMNFAPPRAKRTPADGARTGRRRRKRRRRQPADPRNRHRDARH
jgi:class 3 adenylate cyclase